MSIAEPKAKDELLKTLNRVHGLVEAVFAIGETNANEDIAEGAAYGVYQALEREGRRADRRGRGRENCCSRGREGSGITALLRASERADVIAFPKARTSDSLNDDGVTPFAVFENAPHGCNAGRFYCVASLPQARRKSMTGDVSLSFALTPCKCFGNFLLSRRRSKFLIARREQ